MSTHPHPTELNEVRLNESPPVEVAKGLSTYAGLIGAGLAALPVVIDALTDERIDPGTRRALIIGAIVLLGLVILSRTAQAMVAEVRRGPRALPAIELDGSRFGLDVELDKLREQVERFRKEAAARDGRELAAARAERAAQRSEGDPVGDLDRDADEALLGVAELGAEPEPGPDADEPEAPR